MEFVILRAAVRGYGSSGNLMTDSQIAANIEGALSQNIDVGIYVFSQAVTTEEAVEEAERALDIIKGYDIKLPIYFDSEYSGAPNRTGRADGLTKAERTSLAIAFAKQSEMQAISQAYMRANHSSIIILVMPLSKQRIRNLACTSYFVRDGFQISL